MVETVKEVTDRQTPVAGYQRNIHLYLHPVLLRFNNLFTAHYGADYVCQDMSGPGNKLI